MTRVSRPKQLPNKRLQPTAKKLRFLPSAEASRYANEAAGWLTWVKRERNG